MGSLRNRKSWLHQKKADFFSYLSFSGEEINTRSILEDYSWDRFIPIHINLRKWNLMELWICKGMTNKVENDNLQSEWFFMGIKRCFAIVKKALLPYQVSWCIIHLKVSRKFSTGNIQTLGFNISNSLENMLKVFKWKREQKF